MSLGVQEVRFSGERLPLTAWLTATLVHFAETFTEQLA